MDPQKNEKIEQVVVSQEEQPKKPYEEPQILYREPLEAMANACPDPGFKQSGICGNADS